MTLPTAPPSPQPSSTDVSKIQYCLGVTVLGKDLKAAQAAAYAAVAKIHFDGAHFRGDIAAKAF